MRCPVLKGQSLRTPQPSGLVGIHLGLVEKGNEKHECNVKRENRKKTWNKGKTIALLLIEVLPKTHSQRHPLAVRWLSLAASAPEGCVKESETHR